MKKEKYAWGAIALVGGLIAPVLFDLMNVGTAPLFWADVLFALFAGAMAFKQKTQRVLAAVGILICFVPVLLGVALITGLYTYNIH